MNETVLVSENDGSAVFTAIKLLYASSIGILTGSGNIIEAVIAAVLGYIVLNHLNFGKESSEDEVDS